LKPALGRDSTPNTFAEGKKIDDEMLLRGTWGDGLKAGNVVFHVFNADPLRNRPYDFSFKVHKIFCNCRSLGSFFRQSDRYFGDLPLIQT
jgi:hypothetical protein